MGCATAHFFAPPPEALGGAKNQILLNIIKFQLQSHLQRYFNQTLCVYSQMKDIKHIRRDLHSAPLGDAPGVGLGGYRRGLGGSIFSRNSTRVDALVTHINDTCNGTTLWVPIPWGLREGPKVQISLNLNYGVSFKYF